MEVLATTAITAMLLAAVGAAMHAGLRGYTENDRIAAATQTARNVLNRLDQEVRRCEDASTTSSSLTIIPIADGSGLTQIQYQLTSGVLYYRQTINGNTTSYPLLGGSDRAQVTAFVVNRVAGVDATSQPCTTAVTVRLTVSVEGTTFTVTTTAAPRRNQLY